MKIHYCPQSPVPSLAANSVHVMKMAQALTRAGHDVTLYSPEFKRKALFSTVGDVHAHYGVERIFKYIPVPFPKFNRFRRLSYKLALYYYFMTQKPDLVFARNPDAAIIGQRLSIPTLFEWHDSFANAAPSSRERLLSVIRHKNFRSLIVISQALKTEICNRYDVSPDRIIVAHDGADIMDGHVRPCLPLSTKIRIGYTGHLYQGRGIDVIIAAALKLPQYEFHIVGGHAADIAFWQEKTSDAGNIVFHGHVAPAAVPGFLASFDILVAPYQKQVAVSSGSAAVKSGGNTADWMSPLKIFEYMASGKPIVSSDLSVLKEVLQDNRNCLLCPPEDVFSWVAALKRLAESPELRAQLSNEAMGDFSQHYTWNARSRFILSSAGLSGQSPNARDQRG